MGIIQKKDAEAVITDMMSVCIDCVNSLPSPFFNSCSHGNTGYTLCAKFSDAAPGVDKSTKYPT